MTVDKLSYSQLTVQMRFSIRMVLRLFVIYADGVKRYTRWGSKDFFVDLSIVLTKRVIYP